MDNYRPGYLKLSNLVISNIIILKLLNPFLQTQLKQTN